MATFERDTGSENDQDKAQNIKYPLRILEISIQKFLKVIQIDLARLLRHKHNVQMFNRLQDWTSLHTEQVNATRTVQQIKANILEIEKSRLQVHDEDLEGFDSKVNEMKQNAIKSVTEFIQLAFKKVPLWGMQLIYMFKRLGQAEAVKCGLLKDGSKNSSYESSPNGDLHPLPLDVHSSHVPFDLHDQEVSSDIPSQVPLPQHGIDQLQVDEPPINTSVSESWKHLQENLEELCNLIHQFGSVVQIQQEKIDRIEDNIEKAEDDIREGAQHLGIATASKAAMFPIAGAVIGTAVAGPLGLLAGAKIGGIIGAFGGVAAGYFGGKLLKKRQNEVTGIELSKLSRSNSLPDVKAETEENLSWFQWGLKRLQFEDVASSTVLEK